jgi:hypothetical protein
MLININKLPWLCMCSENLLLLLFGNSENLRDRIQTISSAVEVSSLKSMVQVAFYSK